MLLKYVPGVLSSTILSQIIQDGVGPVEHCHEVDDAFTNQIVYFLKDCVENDYSSLAYDTDGNLIAKAGSIGGNQDVKSVISCESGLLVFFQEFLMSLLNVDWRDSERYEHLYNEDVVRKLQDDACLDNNNRTTRFKQRSTRRKLFSLAKPVAVVPIEQAYVYFLTLVPSSLQARNEKLENVRESFKNRNQNIPAYILFRQQRLLQQDTKFVKPISITTMWNYLKFGYDGSLPRDVHGNVIIPKSALKTNVDIRVKDIGNCWVASITDIFESVVLRKQDGVDFFLTKKEVDTLLQKISSNGILVILQADLVTSHRK